MILISVYILLLLFVILFVAGGSCRYNQSKLNQQYEKYCKETGQPIDDRLEISEMMEDK